jgi:very-short-patch-repair endonuclease
MNNANAYIKLQKTGKKIDQFLRNEGTKVFIRTLIDQGKSIDEILVTKRGKGGGTLFCNELFDYFKMWCNHYTIHNFTRKENIFGLRLKTIFSGVFNIEEQYKFEDYRIDFVINQLGIAIEYNEKYHSKQVEKDIKRKKYISKKSGLNFIVVEEGQEDAGINKIILEIVKRKQEK